ncbi:cytochrome c oxidase assembly protein [Nesterenkonia sp. Act20]|uniref:cytochrome c oxidase assembly protein n=1 Tax=Nesterenkonia sp. Act20 TaxID=1483432 RepID=UPI001C461453|nr:cytochrome c oxidase assembly protein [Nesterenkonia sp. Act20]
MDQHDGGHGGVPAVAGMDWTVLDVVVVLLLGVGALGYALGLWAARGRSPWPLRRTLFWYAGIACAAAGLLGPVAQAAHTSFTAHMIGHLLLGMVAPLLMVLGAPITLTMRALPATVARRLSGFLRSTWIRVLTHPVVAATLNAGGLWLLYTTELFHLMHASAAVYALVHLHLFVAGYLFTASLIGLDPDPHRASMPVRSAVLILFIAAHSILAKWLYAHPPQGVEPADGRAGAQLMYYGGDAVDVTLIVLLFAGWHVATRPRTSRAPLVSPF